MLEKINIFCIKEYEIIELRNKFWQFFYYTLNRSNIFKQSSLANTLKLLSIYMIVSIFILYNVNDLGSYFFIESNFKSLTTFYITTGSALIGTTVLVFTLVMFAMQVNVERMPHGLFRSLSNDRRIVLYFFSTFFLTILIAALSLLDKSNYSLVIASIVFYSFSIVTIVILFIYSYKRALLLINPIQQLNIVISDLDKDISFWMKAYKRFSLVQLQKPEEDELHDFNKIQFFNTNPEWTLKLKQSMKYAMSFSLRYSSQGDYEVSKAALNTIIIINQKYIQAKGKTFFNSNGIIEVFPTTDGIINLTLEDLRQAVKVAIKNNDEQFIEQLFNTFLGLVNIYSKIEYPSNNSEKTHALLANGYLENAVKDIIPHEMTDVIMEGCRIIGKSANIILNTSPAYSLKSTIDILKTIALWGLINEKNGPATLIATEQLSNISLSIILNTKIDNLMITKELREALTTIAKIHINMPSKPMSIQTNIDPYYSHLSQQSFLGSLTQIVNSLLAENEKNKNSSYIIDNIEQWSHQIYIESKELLLLCVEKQSTFISDILNWIKIVTELLMAVSNAISCSEHSKKELKRNALWLISTYTWIPKNENSIQLVESFQFTELIFELILKSYQRDCEEITEEMIKYLLTWGHEAGQIDNIHSVYENSIYALCTLTAILDSFSSVKLISSIKEQSIHLEDEFKTKIAGRIRKKSSSLHPRMATYSTVENYMVRSKKLPEIKKILNDIADLF